VKVERNVRGPSHLGKIRHRSQEVEIRVEQNLERLAGRLQRLSLRWPFATGT
jgi:hypothetical protein